MVAPVASASWNTDLFACLPLRLVREGLLADSRALEEDPLGTVKCVAQRGRASVLAANDKVIEVVEVERLDDLPTAASHHDDATIQRQLWVAVVGDFVCVRHLCVWLESGLARWLPSQAPRHDCVTHHSLFGSVFVAVHIIRVRHWCDLGRRGALNGQRVTFNGLAVLPDAIHEEAESCEAEWSLALESHGLIAAHQRVVVIVGEVVTDRNAGVVGEHRQREGRWLRWVVLFLL